MVNYKTLQAYAKAGIEFITKGNDDYLKEIRAKTSDDNNKQRRM
jgi:hypothetical protein